MLKRKPKQSMPRSHFTPSTTPSPAAPPSLCNTMLSRLKRIEIFRSPRASSWKLWSAPFTQSRAESLLSTRKPVFFWQLLRQPKGSSMTFCCWARFMLIFSTSLRGGIRVSRQHTILQMGTTSRNSPPSSCSTTSLASTTFRCTKLHPTFTGKARKYTTTDVLSLPTLKRSGASAFILGSLQALSTSALSLKTQKKGVEGGWLKMWVWSWWENSDSTQRSVWADTLRHPQTLRLRLMAGGPPQQGIGMSALGYLSCGLSPRLERLTIFSFSSVLFTSSTLISLHFWDRIPLLSSSRLPLSRLANTFRSVDGLQAAEDTNAKGSSTSSWSSPSSKKPFSRKGRWITACSWAGRQNSSSRLDSSGRGTTWMLQRASMVPLRALAREQVTVRSRLYIGRVAGSSSRPQGRYFRTERQQSRSVAFSLGASRMSPSSVREQQRSIFSTNFLTESMISRSRASRREKSLTTAISSPLLSALLRIQGPSWSLTESWQAVG